MSQPKEELDKKTQALFNPLKKYFDLLKDCLECEVECPDIEMMKLQLVLDIQNQLKSPRFPINPIKSSKMDEKNYNVLIENLDNYSFVQMLETFLLPHGLVGTINSFVIDEVNRFFGKYTEELIRLSNEAEKLKLSLEEHNQKRERLYNCFISSVKTIAMDLVPTYKEFYNSETNWKVDSSTGTAHHILTNTVHKLTDSVLPYYLGTSVLEEKSVNVFMDGKSGEVFTMAVE